MQATTMPDKALSIRERECLKLLAEGESTTEIAQKLGIGVPTVVLHLKNAKLRLGARNRNHAIAIAVSNGYL